MKLSVDQVINIREAHASGMKVSYLAMKHGVSTQQVYRILNNQQWGHRLRVHKDRASHQALLDAIAKHR